MGLTPKRIVVFVRQVQRDEINTERLHGVQDVTHQMQSRLTGEGKTGYITRSSMNRCIVSSNKITQAKL